MPTLVVKSILVLALPIVVFYFGASLMRTAAGRGEVMRQLGNAAPADRKPLFMRFFGYDINQVKRHWGALDDNGLSIERRFQEFDLIFPLFYGAALTSALLMAWTAIGRPMQSPWPVAIVLLTVVADWVENLITLSQLSRYMSDKEYGLQAGMVAIASVATSVKLFLFAGSYLVLICLVILMFTQGLKAHT